MMQLCQYYKKREVKERDRESERGRERVNQGNKREEINGETELKLFMNEASHDVQIQYNNLDTQHIERDTKQEAFYRHNTCTKQEQNAMHGNCTKM